MSGNYSFSERILDSMKRYINVLIKHPLFSGSVIMLIGSNGINFLNYVYHIIMARLLGPSGYGELVALISVIGLLGVIPASVSLVVIKYVSSAKTDDEVVNLVGWLKSKSLLIALVLFLLTLMISPFVSSFLYIEKGSYLVLIAVALLFSFSAGLNRSILQGLLKFKEMIITIFTEGMIKIVVSIVLVFLGFQVGGAVLGFVVSAIIGWYLTRFCLRGYNQKSSHIPTNIKSMFLFVIPVIIQALATTSLYSSDLILVKHFFTSHDAGIYASLSTLGRIIFFATGPISAVMFPLVSKRLSQGDNYKKIFVYSFTATAFFAFSLLIVYWFIPQLVIRFLYGTLYLEQSHLLVWFGLFMTLFTFSSIIINFNLSLGRTKIVIFPFLAAFVQILLIWMYHISLVEVVFISTVITALLLLSLLIYSSYKERFFKWK